MANQREATVDRIIELKAKKEIQLLEVDETKPYYSVLEDEIFDCGNAIRYSHNLFALNNILIRTTSGELHNLVRELLER